MATITLSKKAAGVLKLFKPSVQSFPAAVSLEDNPAARSRRPSRRDIPLRCRCRAASPCVSSMSASMSTCSERPSLELLYGFPPKAPTPSNRG
jgi:hypothetical protein